MKEYQVEDIYCGKITTVNDNVGGKLLNGIRTQNKLILLTKKGDHYVSFKNKEYQNINDTEPLIGHVFISDVKPLSNYTSTNSKELSKRDIELILCKENLRLQMLKDTDKISFPRTYKR